MVIIIIRLLFLFFLYLSNATTILSIYPILFYLIKYTSDINNWYYFGLVFSSYELGKFCSISLWDRLSNKISIIFLILISLFLLSILNLSFCFISKLFHIIIIRFLLGFCNHTGTFFKNIYIQMGFRKNNKIIIFLISIISMALALFLPSIMIHLDFGQIIKIKNIKLKNIMLIYIFFALNNILAIIFCSILIYTNTLKINTGFYQMNNSEKTENSIDGPYSPQKSNIVDIEQKSNSQIIKTKKNSETEINIINQNKIINDTDSSINKSEKSTDNKSYNIKENGKKNLYNNDYKNKMIFIKRKEIQFCFIQTLINIIDGLGLIWTLIILYIKFKENCLTISLYISILKIFGEIILFPINKSITNKSNFSSNLNSILKKMRIINIILLLFSILISQIIFSIYYYSEYSNMLTMIIFIPLLIKTILSGIFTQLYKIYTDKFFKQNNIKSKKLKTYNQYFGSLSKAIVYIIGSFGILIIKLIINKNNNTQIILSLLYFHIIPQIFNVILLIACFKYIV